MAELMEHDVVDDGFRHDGQVGVHGDDAFEGHAGPPARPHDPLFQDRVGQGEAGE